MLHCWEGFHETFGTCVILALLLTVTNSALCNGWRGVGRLLHLLSRENLWTGSAWTEIGRTVCSIYFSETSALNALGGNSIATSFCFQEGGCSVPVAVNTMLKDGQVRNILYVSGIIYEKLFQCVHVLWGSAQQMSSQLSRADKGYCPNQEYEKAVLVTEAES